VHPDENYKPGVCRVCDRYIGAVNVCPYCDERVVRPRPVRILRLAAVLLAVGGLAMLFVVARTRDVPVVKAGDLTALMNRATVRLRGTVDQQPYLGRDDEGRIDYVSFRIHDGSGRIRVAAYDGTARALVASDALPARGDEIDVTGNVRISNNGEHRLRLASPEQITRAE